MIKSMTGYGSAKGYSERLEISIELRSVNSRYLDCGVKIPRIYLFAEDKLKAAVQRAVTRGKVDVFVNVDSSKTDSVTIAVNEPLVEAYLEALSGLSEKFGLKNDVSAISFTRIPDVLNVEKQEVDSESLLRDMTGILDEALLGFNSMRELEGEKLHDDISRRLILIEDITSRIEEKSPQTVEEYRNKLELRMNEVLSDIKIDESRILTEAAIFADRIAVNEETTRLRSHISQLNDLMAAEGAVGRKLDFLLQELGREVNTIGSKCNNTDMSRLVIELKAEIEKIREQAQNIE